MVLSQQALSDEVKAVPERLRKRGFAGTRDIFLNQGHFFGELALMLPNQLRTASVVALGPVQSYCVASAQWASLLDNYYMLRAPVLNAFLERAYELYRDAQPLLDQAKRGRVLKVEALVDAELLARTAAVSVVTFDAHGGTHASASARDSSRGSSSSGENEEPASLRLKDPQAPIEQLSVLVEDEYY